MKEKISKKLVRTAMVDERSKAHSCASVHLLSLLPLHTTGSSAARPRHVDLLVIDGCESCSETFSEEGHGRGRFLHVDLRIGVDGVGGKQLLENLIRAQVGFENVVVRWEPGVRRTRRLVSVDVVEMASTDATEKEPVEGFSIPLGGNNGVRTLQARYRDEIRTTNLFERLGRGDGVGEGFEEMSEQGVSVLVRSHEVSEDGISDADGFEKSEPGRVHH